MSDKIEYAKVGGPPANWQGLRIIDLRAEREVDRVIEVNTKEGWLIKHPEPLEVCRGEPECPLCKTGNPGDHVRAERVEGRFLII
jgi:hypothetical protein